MYCLRNDSCHGNVMLTSAEHLRSVMQILVKTVHFKRRYKLFWTLKMYSSLCERLPHFLNNIVRLQLTPFPRFQNKQAVIASTTMNTTLEQRYSIKFCILLRKTRKKTLAMITGTYGEAAMSRTRIYEWFNTFTEDATADANDQPRCGRSNTTLVKADERLRRYWTVAEG